MHLISQVRSSIASGDCTPEALVRFLAEVPAKERDEWCEELFGIRNVPMGAEVSLPDRIGYSPCSVATIVRTVFAVPLRESDVMVDLGSGLGKVCILSALLSGARAIGIEVQSDLVEIAAARARALNVKGASFRAESATTADLSEGNVFFLYIPFTGELLEKMLARIREVAATKPIVVCAVGFDLPRVPWLTARKTDAFWLTLYDSDSPRAPLPLSSDAATIVVE